MIESNEEVMDDEMCIDCVNYNDDGYCEISEEGMEIWNNCKCWEGHNE